MMHDMKRWDCDGEAFALNYCKAWILVLDSRNGILFSVELDTKWSYFIRDAKSRLSQFCFIVLLILYVMYVMGDSLALMPSYFSFSK